MGCDRVTPVHDHGTWGVIGIYQGVEHEVCFKPAVISGDVRFRQTEERDIAERHVIVCCTSDQDIHRVSPDRLSQVRMFAEHVVPRL